MNRPTPINCLSQVDSVSAGDLVPVYVQSAGGTRAASFTTIAAFMAANAPAPSGMITQTSSPSVSPFTVTLPNMGSSMWLILTPTGTMAVGTIVLPPQGIAVDGQELLVNSTQIVTALTITAAGSSVTGAPTTLAANGAFRLKYTAVNNTWYRVSP